MRVSYFLQSLIAGGSKMIYYKMKTADCSNMTMQTFTNGNFHLDLLEPVAMLPNMDTMHITQTNTGEIVAVWYNDYVLPSTTPDDILFLVWDPATLNFIQVFFTQYESYPISTIGHNQGGSDSILVIASDGTKIEIINVSKDI